MDETTFERASNPSRDNQLDLLAVVGSPTADERRAVADTYTSGGKHHLTADLTLRHSHDFQEIKGIAPKTDLTLVCKRATDEDLRVLSGIHDPENKPHSIVSLSLKGTGVTDRGMLFLQHLTSLKTLNLSYTGVGDEGIKAVSKLPDLQVLDLTATDVSSKGIALLAQMPQLHTLWVDGEKDVLGSVSKIAALQHIFLQADRFNLDRQIIENIRGCKNLKAVSLFDPREGVNAVGANRSDSKAIEELSRKLPNILVSGHWANRYDLNYRDGRLIR